MDNGTDTTPKMIVHAEADLGSSLINLQIENADAVQLLALSQMLHANGMAALMGQMAMESPTRSPIEIVRGNLGVVRHD